ncbi:MAG: response regulator [Pseudomonadota bacterium]
MQFSFLHPDEFHESTYDLVDALSDADFAVVDADSQPAVKGVVLSGRVGQAVFVGGDAPEGAASHLPRPIDPRRILRTLDQLTARRAGATRRAEELADPIVSELPVLEDEVVDLLLEPPSEPLPTPTAPSEPEPEAEAESDAASNAALRSAARAAARAAARRARLASARADMPPGEPLRDVLVFDDDDVDAAHLCRVLEQFGFVPRSVAELDAAAELMNDHPFAAIFLDIELDDAGVALLQQARELPGPPGHPGPAVLMVAEHLDPADRVRAALAGIDMPLVKPLSRGDVARALEAARVVLPADARRL